MDPISLVIIAALLQGANLGLTEVTKSVVTDTYKGLRNLITKKFSSHNELIDALNRIEQMPDSEGRKQALIAEVKAANLLNDSEIVTTSHELLKILKEQPQGDAYIQIARGSYIAQADHGSTASVTINGTPDK